LLGVVSVFFLLQQEDFSFEQLLVAEASLLLAQQLFFAFFFFFTGVSWFSIATLLFVETAAIASEKTKEPITKPNTNTIFFMFIYLIIVLQI